MKNQAKPNGWATRQHWRYPLPNDQQQARQLRHTLRRLRLSPRRDLSQWPHLAVWEANCRAALPDIVAELNRNDIITLTTIARLLVLVRGSLPSHPLTTKNHRRAARCRW